MRWRSVVVLMIVLFSCNTREERTTVKPKTESKPLKPYQQYALDRLLEADIWDQGFSLSDSFYLWSWDDFGKDFKYNRITRVYDDGYYHYIFWTRRSDTSFIYAEDSISPVHLIKDTLFDVNGDGLKDFVVTWNPGNGNCPPGFTILFLLDSPTKRFKRIDIIDHIPNVKFHPKEGTITSDVTCDLDRERFKFKWNKDFGLDTIYHKLSMVPKLY